MGYKVTSVHQFTSAMSAMNAMSGKWQVDCLGDGRRPSRVWW